MTKKRSFFNQILYYLQRHPLVLLSWIWVTIVPFLGSLWMVSNYTFFSEIPISGFSSLSLYSLIAALAMRLALIPTTLTSLLTGYWLGWIGFPIMVLAYSLANVIGYLLGHYLNIDFRDFVFRKYPDLELAFEKRMQRIGSLIFFVRISPVIPFAISNFLFASLKIPLKQVLVYGIPGMLPRTLMAFLAGIIASDFLEARENLQEPWQILLVFILLIASIWGIWRNWKLSKA
jgi:uncharacterized membrane protein YdjX (TVP38/TMEM64 family)